MSTILSESVDLEVVENSFKTLKLDVFDLLQSEFDIVRISEKCLVLCIALDGLNLDLLREWFD